MLRIKNVTRGSISLKLEKSTITLQSGKVIDLDQSCSREYTDNYADLQTYIRTKCLMVLGDTRVSAAPKEVAPEKPVQKKAPAPVPAKVQPPAESPAKDMPPPKRKFIRADPAKSLWE